MVQVQLIDYFNRDLQLPNGQTCVCPSGFSCNYLGTFVPRCFMSFTVILSSQDESVKYFSTEFVPLTPSGKIDISSMSEQQQLIWHQPHIFYLTSKPSAIDIFVHHMGAVINAQTGELTQIQTVLHVDTFIQPLKSVIPSTQNDHHSTITQTLNGVILQTQLTLTFAIQCIKGLIGPNCDLICNVSASNAANAICRSNLTNFFFVCSYMINGQVHDCVECPWGISQESYCQSADGGILNPSTAGVVSSSYKIATIVLGIVAGILLILFILIVIYTLLMNRRMQEGIRHSNNANSGHNYRSALRTEGNANRPLLQVCLALQNIAYLIELLSVTESSLRKLITSPPAHLGGASSLNDTLNSTLSSVPLPPSKEADV
ncbi:unnamed protein product [Thelazia callipaeda]|uniref:EGF-like domain-containing protein n=1 Tax=Thelazia callipaeda TaxID=103827 RepID=A0A0N5D5C3_THECL|nr:unnamed protein product [Thelazia callipaeda]